MTTPAANHPDLVEVDRQHLQKTIHHKDGRTEQIWTPRTNNAKWDLMTSRNGEQRYYRRIKAEWQRTQFVGKPEG